MLLPFSEAAFLSHSAFSAFLFRGICGPQGRVLSSALGKRGCGFFSKNERFCRKAWKLRHRTSFLYVSSTKTILENYPMPVSWHLCVVNLPMCLQEPSGASLKKGQASHLVIFLLAGSLTERHKHSLKMKATKINSNQPCMKTLMQNMQAGLLFIWQKAVLRRSRPG